MTLRFLPLLFSFLLAPPLSAQCNLTATVSDVVCDTTSGAFFYRLTITGDATTVTFDGFGVDAPLPFDDYLFATPGQDSVVIRLSSVTGNDICSTAVTAIAPNNCFATATDYCSVHVEAGDADVCGQASTLTASAIGRPPFTYVWSTGDTTQHITDLISGQFYSVTVTDAGGCSSTGHYLNSVHASFYVHVESSGDACAGEAPQLTAATYGHLNHPLTYQWNDGQTGRTITVDPETNYTVTITDALGCSITGNGFYHPGSTLRHVVIDGPHTLGCDGNPITLSVEDPDPEVDYTWVYGQDTFFGTRIQVDYGGYYTITGVRRGNPGCTYRGSGSVNNPDISVKDLFVVAFGDPCGGHACYGVFADGGQFNLSQASLTWTYDGNAYLDGHGNIICSPDAGEYSVFIDTGCDTFTYAFTVDDTNCTQVCGTIVPDFDQDCTDDGNMDFANVVALLTNVNTGVSYLVHVNADGTYCVTVPDGKYGITILGDLMTITTDCQTVEPLMDVNGSTPAQMTLYAVPYRETDTGQATTSVFGQREEAARLRVFPNPTEGSFNLDLSGIEVSSTARVSLYDALGRRVTTSTIGDLPRPWHPRDLTPGLYRVVLTDGAGRTLARAGIVVR